MSNLHVLIYSNDRNVMQCGVAQSHIWKLRLVEDSRQGKELRDFFYNIAFNSLEEAKQYAKNKNYTYTVMQPSKVCNTYKSYVNIITKDPLL